MPEKSIVREAGGRVKDFIGGRRRHGDRGGHRDGDRRGDRGRQEGRRGDRETDGFEDAESFDWIYGALFFVFIVFILSPGVLLTIPPGRGGLLMSGSTSTLAAFVHAVLLVTLLSFI